MAARQYWECYPTASISMKVILLHHFLASAAFFVLSVWDLTKFSNNCLRCGSRIAIAAYAIFAFPSILIGFWGVVQKMEKPLRFYFYYFTLHVAVNGAYVVDTALHVVPCTLHVQLLPDVLQCGWPRSVVVLLLTFVVASHICMAFRVYAYCEALKYDMLNPEIIYRGKDGKVPAVTGNTADPLRFAAYAYGSTSEFSPTTRLSQNWDGTLQQHLHLTTLQMI